MTYKVNEARARRVGEAFKLLGMRSILLLEEKGDPQRGEALRVAKSSGRGPGAVAGLLVALASYRLAMRGEEWWRCYGDYMTENLPAATSLEEVYRTVRSFLVSCKGAAIGREAKLKRVYKVYSSARPALQELMTNPDLLLTNEYPNTLLATLMKSLNEKRPAKTIVFSIKIAYYHARPPGELRPLHLHAPIPVDVRVSCLSISSGIVEGLSYRGLVAKPEAAWRAWSLVEETSGVPMPHIDTVAWLTGWAPRDLSLPEARARIAEILAPYTTLDVARRVAVELAVKECS